MLRVSLEGLGSGKGHCYAYGHFGRFLSGERLRLSLWRKDHCYALCFWEDAAGNGACAPAHGEVEMHDNSRRSVPACREFRRKKPPARGAGRWCLRWFESSVWRGFGWVGECGFRWLQRWCLRWFGSGDSVRDLGCSRLTTTGPGVVLCRAVSRSVCRCCVAARDW